MTGLSRQIIDFGSLGLFLIFWFFVVTIVVVYMLTWFQNSMKRMERTLEEIKKQLEGRPQGRT